MMTQYIPKQVLLLSERPNGMASIAALLHQIDFQTHQANTVAQAIEALEHFSPSVIIAEQDVSDGTTAECIERAKFNAEPPSIILISDLVDLKQMIRAINQNDVFQFLLRPFDDEVLTSVCETAHQDHIIRNAHAQLKTTVSAYRQVNQVLEDQLNATHITGEYAPGIQLGLDGSVQGPEEVTVAVGFLEVSHFDTIYEQLGLERAGEILRSIMTHVHEVVHSHEGNIDKHLKEGLVFFFPVEAENQLQVINTAVRDICNEFESLSSLSELQGLHLSIGVSFGKIMRIPIGSYQHQEISLIGETVNLAARLMEYAQYLASVAVEQSSLDRCFTVLFSDDFIDKDLVKPFTVPEGSWIRDFAKLRAIARLNF